MSIILLVVLVAFSLLYGVQGGAQCVKGSGANSSAFCGCQLKDSANNTVINITLGSDGKKKVYHDLIFKFTYSPCSSNSDCGDGKAAVCRKMRDDPFGHKSIGSLDSVTYTVNDPTFVNVSATYSGPEGTSVVYLVCDNKNDGSFTFVHHYREKKTYYFQLGHSAFCIPPNPSTTSKSMITTVTSTATAVTTMTVHTTLTTTGTNTLTVTTTMPSITTGVVTTATSTVSPTSTSSPSKSKKDEDQEKIVLVVVVLAIVGVMVLGITVAVIVAYVRKKKRAQYELIPSL